MIIREISKITRTWGVNTKAIRKKENIIRDIQISEGYSPCFRTKDTCNENDCLLKKDCTSGR